MNKERFNSLVKNPALLNADDAIFLSDIINEFPLSLYRKKYSK